MNLPTRPLPFALGLAFAVLISGCCCPTKVTSPVSIASADHPVSVKFDKDKFGRSSGTDAYGSHFLLKAYRIDQIWGGAGGYPSTIPYRAAILLYATYADDDTGNKDQAVAQLLFFDPATEDLVRKSPNPDAKNPNPPLPGGDPRYYLHFPMSTFDGIVRQLANGVQPVYLVFYRPAGENEWAICTIGDTTMTPKP